MGLIWVMAGVFLQKNITGAYQVIKKPPKSVVKVIRITAPAKDAVYNYSIQTLNSAELAKKELYREMGKVRPRMGSSQAPALPAGGWGIQPAPFSLSMLPGCQQRSPVCVGGGGRGADWVSETVRQASCCHQT